jgi:hypothetical protein
MPILGTELKIYRAATISSGSDNGGVISAGLAGSGVANAIFPNITESERVAGATDLRKVFYKVANDSDIALLNSKVYISQETVGDDAIAMHTGTFTNTQGDLTGSEALYGCASLNVSATATDTAIEVLVEDWATTPIFRDGDEIRITNKANVSDAGDEEFAIISGAPSVLGNLITLTLSTGLVSGYSNTDTKVSSVMSIGTIQGVSTAPVVTSSAGTYDNGSYPILVDSIGGISESYTLTFTSATGFTCIGSITGSLGSGTVSSNFSPVNASFAKPFFTIYTAGFGGTFVANDTITFTTSPAAAPVWLKRVVPAGATSISGNNFIIALQGESA